MAFVLTEKKENVLKITLNRPEKFNSFIRPMSLELQHALDEAKNDPEIRAIYLTGEGKAFCAGQDLVEAVDSKGVGIEKIVREHYNPIITKIRALEKPVVCGVMGAAAGAGANVALACDIVVAGNTAFFSQAFSKIGLIPDSGGTFLLPRLIGFQRATALMMLGEKTSAQEALQMGMIYKVVEDVNLHQEAFAIAQTLSQMPTKAIGFTKRLLNESATNNLQQQLEREATIQAEAALSYDFQEGVKSFLEKRKPVFKGA